MRIVMEVTFYSLIYFPDQMPTIETCVRLAKATGYSANEFLRLAGIVETTVLLTSIVIEASSTLLKP